MQLLTALLFIAAPALQAAAPACAGKPSCLENPSFAVSVSDFRTSVSGRYRVATATLRFSNRLPKPLILGYVNGSGVVTDDQGNRYTIGANGVRGIGVVGGSTVDGKFALEPGEESEARFEFVWEPGRAVIGTRFDMDLAVREIDTIPGNQYRLGKERVLHFTSPGAQVAAAGATSPPGATPAPAPIAATTAAAATPIEADPCKDLPHCVAAGQFIVQVVGVTPQGGPRDRHHQLALQLRFRNVSAQPVVLGYQATTSVATDNLGNRYIWGRPGTHDTSASGIGTVTARAAEASFALAPGQSREATFRTIRYNSLGKPLGMAWVYDVVVTQLEILPSQQVRALRDHSLHFDRLSARPLATPVNVDEAVQGLKGLLKKK